MVQHSLTFAPKLGLGFGRIEDVTDARQAIYMLEALHKNGVLSRQLSNEEVVALAQKISSEKNKRFFDSRLHKIDEISAVDSFFVASKALSKNDASYFTALYDMMKKKMNAVAYELIKDEQKAFPVVSSISEIEGGTAIALAAELMSNERGGKGILLGGVAGISPTEVLILGAGITGSVAARTALALGAQVKIFDHDINKLRKIQHYLGQQVFTSVIHPNVLIKALASADAVIGNLRYINDNERFMLVASVLPTMLQDIFFNVE